MPSSTTTDTDGLGPGSVLSNFRFAPAQLCRRVHQIFVSRTSIATREAGLASPEYASLVAITAVPGIDQRGLGSALMLDGASIVQLIDDLEAKGLVERRIGQDRRVRHLHVTAVGRKVTEAVRPKVLAARDQGLAALTSSERATLMELLIRVIESNPEHDRPGAAREIRRRHSASPEGKDVKHRGREQARTANRVSRSRRKLQPA